MDRGFPRSSRLLLPSDFERVMKDGFRVWTWNLIVFARPNELEFPRLGLATGRKVGNAVARNRWKRLTREVFRNTIRHDLGGIDLVVAVKAVPGFDRNRGDNAGSHRKEPSGKRPIPSLIDLEGELADALRRIDRKMAGRIAGSSAVGPD